MQSICVFSGSSHGRGEKYVDYAEQVGAELARRGITVVYGGARVGTMGALAVSLHHRKALMAEHTDAFIALPGGPGTLEELFEIWTWAQLKVHVKPVGLLNVADYFTPLVTFLEHITSEGFLHQPHRDMLLVEQEIGTLLDRFAAYGQHAACRADDAALCDRDGADRGRSSRAQRADRRSGFACVEQLGSSGGVG